MKIEIRKQVTLAGQVVRIGEVVEASPSDATILIGSNCAVVAPEVVPQVAPKATPEEPKPKPAARRRAKQ